MIDLHSHVLPGIDDGALTMKQSLAICRGAVKEGTTIICATPHVRYDHPTTADVMEQQVGELRRALVEERIPLEVLPGGEIAIEWLSCLSIDELRRFGLGGNPGYLLVEFAHYGWPDDLHGWIADLGAHGMTVMLAHPERSAAVQADPERLRPFVEAGTLVQVTAASVEGRSTQKARTAALALIDAGLAHVVASDVHCPGSMLERAVAAIDDEELARWLTLDLPAAIVRGGPLPPRPAPARAS